jgi:hypothetical protein
VSVSYRRHPNASQRPLSTAQKLTIERWGKAHPRVRAKVGGVGRLSGFVSIIVPGLDPDSYPTIDPDGYFIAWQGHGRGWVRLKHPLNPNQQEELSLDV